MFSIRCRASSSLRLLRYRWTHPHRRNHHHSAPSVHDINNVVILRKVSLLEDLSRGAVDERRTAHAMQDKRALNSHYENQATIDWVEAQIRSRNIIVRLVEQITNADVKWADLVVSVGGDGTFLRASHAVYDCDPTPILGVNSSPGSSYGYFCAADRRSFPALFDKMRQGELELFPLWRMRVLVNNDEYKRMVLNDALFAAEVPGSTTRYTMVNDGLKQSQRSSGVWIATSAGSTAAIRSSGGDIMPLTEKRLQYRVRELFRESVTGQAMVGGVVSPDFCLTSRIPWCRLYLDGANHCIDLEFGDEVTFKQSHKPLWWVRPEQSEGFWDASRWRDGTFLVQDADNHNGAHDKSRRHHHKHHTRK